MVALLSFSNFTWSQEGQSLGSIAGVIVATETGQALPYASVMIVDTKLRLVADEKGMFRFPSVSAGAYSIVVNLVGYHDTQVEGIIVKPGKETELKIQLSESTIPLAEVQVTGERARRLEDVRASVLSVSPVRTKTLAGVGEDVLRTLQAYPGVLSPSDFTSQLVVRGSGPDQNLIVMDDIEIFNPYRLYGLISMFNPETVADINLITGGFPTRYGDRLSAVLDVTNREGDRSAPLRGSLNASITNANVVLNGHAPFGVDGSYVLSARRTYYDLILGPIAKSAGLVQGDVAFPNFSDVQAKFVMTPFAGHKFIATGIISKDGVDLITGSDSDMPDSLRVVDDTRNDVVGIAWHYLPSTQFFSRLTTSWYRNAGTTEFGGEFVDPSLDRTIYENGGDTTGIRFFTVEFDSRYVFRKYSVKEELTWALEGHTLEAGASVDFLKTQLIWHFRPDDVFRSILTVRGIAFEEEFLQTKEYNRYGVYLQDKVKVSGTFSLQPGLRFDHFEILGKSYLQPRFNLLFSLDPVTTLRGAWGIYYQSPGYEKLLDQNSFLDLTNSAVGTLKAEKATHYVLGVERWLDPEWQIRLEAYYKRFDDVIVQRYMPGTVIKTSPIPGGDIRRRSGWTTPIATQEDSPTTDPSNEATGRAIGFEVLLEKKNKSQDSRLSGWISYALASAERVRDGITTPFRFDQLHTLNVVLDYKISSWLEAGIRWRYGTNFPYTPPIGISPRIVNVSRGGVRADSIQVDPNGNVIFDIDRGREENKNSARFSPYHRLDVRLTAHADYWGWDWSFYLDVINAYNHKNVLNYRFFINDDLTVGRSPTHMLPILPTLGVSVRF